MSCFHVRKWWLAIYKLKHKGNVSLRLWYLSFGRFYFLFMSRTKRFQINYSLKRFPKTLPVRHWQEYWFHSSKQVAPFKQSFEPQTSSPWQPAVTSIGLALNCSEAPVGPCCDSSKKGNNTPPILTSSKQPLKNDISVNKLDEAEK